jgi:hypothetical protein
MSSKRFRVVAGALAADVEFSEDGERAAFQYGQTRSEARPTDVGQALWAAMRQANVKSQDVNRFMLHEGSGEGPLVAAVFPILEGAHAMWTVLYRADQDASVFRSLASRAKVSDALNAAFTQIARDVARPHKP